MLVWKNPQCFWSYNRDRVSKNFQSMAALLAAPRQLLLRLGLKNRGFDVFPSGPSLNPSAVYPLTFQIVNIVVNIPEASTVTGTVCDFMALSVMLSTHIPGVTVPGM